MRDALIRRRTAAARYRKAAKKLADAMAKRDAIPAPSQSEPKHVAARRAKSAKRVAEAAIETALASNEDMHANSQLDALIAKPKPKKKM